MTSQSYDRSFFIAALEAYLPKTCYVTKMARRKQTSLVETSKPRGSGEENSL